MIDRATYVTLAVAMLGLAVVTFLALRFVVAPYGRHARPGWGPTLPERLGWMVMESPSLVLFAAIFAVGAHRAQAAPIALAAMWLTHYGHRTLVYPFRLRGHKHMPAMVVVLGFGFNLLNATINASWISGLGTYPAGWITGGRFLAGAALFVAGMAVNLDADRRLFALRREAQGYAIPRGGLYTWVSCPNYLGEIVEWSGWALASWSLGGAAFAVYTIANLAPRAASHHAWYLQRFSEYPRERRALVPFVW